MTSERLSMHQTWCMSYRMRRYCQHLSQPELNRRLRDIVTNLLLLTPGAKIGVLSITPENMRWMEIWTHALQEMVLRHGPFPNGFTRDILHAEPFPDFLNDVGKAAAKHVASRGASLMGSYIKFGKKEHMEALFRRGAIRVRPASYYVAPDHNGAVRDDELALSLSFAIPASVLKDIVANPHNVPDNADDQRLDLTLSAGSDYWLYCVAASMSPRLFVDFDATSCVVVKDRKRFEEMMRQASADVFAPAVLECKAVGYVDPVLPPKHRIDVAMSKHFRYSYQDEHRFVWRPRDTTCHVPYVDLELGSLEAFAELVEL